MSQRPIVSVLLVTVGYMSMFNEDIDCNLSSTNLFHSLLSMRWTSWLAYV